MLGVKRLGEARGHVRKSPCETIHAGTKVGKGRAKFSSNSARCAREAAARAGTHIARSLRFGRPQRSSPDSDNDVLVDVAPDARFSRIDLVEVKDFLEDWIGRIPGVSDFGLHWYSNVVPGPKDLFRPDPECSAVVHKGQIRRTTGWSRYFLC